MIDNLSKILSDLDFSFLYFNISFRHNEKKNCNNLSTLFYDENDGDDFFSESNCNRNEEKRYIKINKKYYKLDKEKYNLIYINVNTPNDFIDIEVHDELNSEKYKVLFDRNIVQFFEGNSLNGYIN